MSLICSVIGEYLLRYQVTVVHFNSVGYEPANFVCDRLAISVLVLTNLTLLMGIVENGFVSREKYLIVVTSTSLILSNEFKREMNERERIGFSRWIWRSALEDSMSLMKFSRFLLCLSIFVEGNSSINVPASFIHCDRRRFLTIDTVSQIETFPEKVMTFTCQKFCADMPNRVHESRYMGSVVRYLNLTSWHVIRTVPNSTFEAQSLEELRYLRRRAADFSMTPSPITLEKLLTSSLSLPSYYFESRLLSWRMETQTMGGSGMFGMLDVRCWIGTVIFVLLQIMIFRRAFTADTSKALCLVLGILFWQPARERSAFSWKLNAFFLYMAAFYLGSIFRNALISRLNIRIHQVIDDDADLRRAMSTKKVERLCIPQFGHYMSGIGKGINRYGILRVLDEAAASNNLLVSSQPRECVDFWLAKRTHACFLVRPYEYLNSKFELASVHLSEKTGQSVMIGRAHSPWHPYATQLNLLSLIIFESSLFYDFNRTINARSELLRPPPSPVVVLKLSDLNVAFIALGATLLFLSAYHVVKYIEINYKRSNTKKRQDPRDFSSNGAPFQASSRMALFCTVNSPGQRDKNVGFDSFLKYRHQGSSLEYSPDLRVIRDSTLRSVRRYEELFAKQVYSETGSEVTPSPTFRPHSDFTWKWSP